MLHLNKEPPKRVVVESDGGNLAIGLGKKAILVAVNSEARDIREVCVQSS